MRLIVSIIALIAFTAVSALPTNDGFQDFSLSSNDLDGLPDLGPNTLPDDFFDGIDGLTPDQKKYIREMYPKWYAGEQDWMKRFFIILDPRDIELGKEILRVTVKRRIEEAQKSTERKKRIKQDEEEAKDQTPKGRIRRIQQLEQELEKQQSLLEATKARACKAREKLRRAAISALKCDQAIEKILTEMASLRKQLEAQKEVVSSGTATDRDQIPVEDAPLAPQATKFFQDRKKDLDRGMNRVVQSATQFAPRVGGVINGVDGAIKGIDYLPIRPVLGTPPGLGPLPGPL